MVSSEELKIILNLAFFFFWKMVFKNEKYQRKDCLLVVFVCRMSSMVAGKTKVKHSFHIK